MNAPVLRTQEAAVFRLILIGILKARTPSSTSFYDNVVTEIWNLNSPTFAFMVSIDDRQFQHLRSK